MDEKTMQARMDDLDRKLDLVLAEVEAQRRLRNGIEDLQDDLMRVGTDVYKTAVLELEEFNDTMNTGDAILLGKQLLRNVKSIRTAFEQLESVRDFINDFSSISGDMFNNVLLKLDELDRKGYFELLGELEKTLDSVVSSFGPDDIRRLNESIPIFAGIVKRLSRPELLRKAEAAVSAFDEYEFDQRKTSIFRLAGEMTKPEARKGMLYMLGLFNTVVREVESA